VRMNRSCALSVLACLSLSAFVSVDLSPVFAQEPPPRPRSLSDVYMDTLEAALPKMRRESNGRPLLIVDPSNIRPFMEDYSKIPPPLQETGSGGYPLRAVLDHFQMKEFTVGTVDLFAPAEMTILNSNPGRANPYLDLHPGEVIMRLISSLDKRQFGLLCSSQGLGLNDLKQNQRDLFLASLPEEMKLRRMEATAPSTPPQGLPEGVTMPPVMIRMSNMPAVELTPQQRNGVRLQISRNVSYMFRMSGQEGSYTGVGSSRNRKIGDTWFDLESSTRSRSRSDNSAYGVVLKQKVPNKLKTGQLNFDAPVLNTLVPLTTPVTISEMLARISKATGVEFLADKRVGQLPLWTSAPRMGARAGDILKVLALSVSGAYRRIGPVYLLTEEVEGLGPRAMRIVSWADEASQVVRQEQEVFRKRAAEENLGSLVGFADDTTITIPEATKQEIMGRGSFGFTGISLSALSAKEQQEIRDMMGRIRAPGGIEQDKVYVQPQMALKYLIPGVGAVSDGRISAFSLDSLLTNRMGGFVPPPRGNMPAPPPRPTEPIPLGETPYRALILPAAALDSDEAAQKILKEAAWRGFNAVWVTLQAGEDTAPLTRTIAAGKAVNIRVGALVRMLIPSADTAAEQKDLTINGETMPPAPTAEQISRGISSTNLQRHEWRRVDSPKSVAALKKNLLTIAEIPELAAFVLMDTAAPGYAPPSRREGMMLRTDASQFGYTTELRLAFLRKEGVDPIDVYYTGSYPEVRSVVLQPPAFRFEQLNPAPPVKSELLMSSGGFLLREGRIVRFAGGSEGGPWAAAQDMLKKWGETRNTANVSLMNSLYIALRGRKPELPLFVKSRAGEGFFSLYTTWFGSWDKGEVMPQYDPFLPGQLDEKARKSSQKILMVIRPSTLAEMQRPNQPAPTEEKRIEDLRARLKGQMSANLAKWDGLTLDLSDTAPEQILSTLSAVAVKEK
jgi:hypothetical protein